MPGYIEQNITAGGRSTPMSPPTGVRTMAEWEEIQAVIITWSGQQTILKEIVRNAVKECKVLIITTDTINVTNQLTSAGISLDSVRFVDAPFNSIWVRDYGPWTVYANDADSLWLVDWIYNRPRPADDATPVAIANYLGIPLYEATVDPDDFVHTGGNHLPDGMGNVFSSMLVLEENNDKTEDEIDSIARHYLGVKQYIKLPTLPYDGIHHLDMHMRIIDEETIIFGEYPEGVADGPQINANIEYLAQEVRTAFGHPYHIIRIPMPPDGSNRYPDQGGAYRTYTNSVFLNKTILVPTYEEKYDTTALRIYRENLPGYNVVGINCNSIIPSLGALHCITKLVGVKDPLLIAHSRLRDTEDTVTEYPVSAYIRHSSGVAEANLFYRLSGDSLYTKLPMITTDSLHHIWSSVIPVQEAGTEIQYYISAKSNSGKEQVRPIVAPQGYFKFKVIGEPANQLPVVSILSPVDESVFSTTEPSVSIEMEANDIDGMISQLVIYINGDSITSMDTVPYNYDWTLPGEGEYEIIAKVTDDKGALAWSSPVNIKVEATTGIINSNINAISFYPNPVDDVLWIRSDQDSVTGVSIINLFGQKISIPQIANGSLVGIKMSHLPAGFYFLQWIQEGKVLSTSVVKR